MNFKQDTTETYKTQEIKSQIETRQLGSKQDHAAHGSYVNGFTKTYWAAAFDGHGKPTAIEEIRKLNLTDIMKEPRPWTTIQTVLDRAQESREHIIKSGSTMVYAKIHLYPDETEVQIVNIGDSKAIVFINDEPIFITTSHSYENGKEIARLVQEGRVDPNQVFIDKDFDFEVISKTTLKSKTGTYVYFNTPLGKQELAMTQCLGHNGYTGLKPNITTIRCNTTDRIRVVLCSDGVTDIVPVNGLDSHDTFSFMTDTTTTLIDEAERRWKQQWLVQENKGQWKLQCEVQDNTDLRKISKTKFPKNGYDDCCCAILAVQPNPEPKPTLAADPKPTLAADPEQNLEPNLEPTLDPKPKSEEE